MAKRRMLLASLAVCLVALLAFGSLAYFTAKDEAKNTFLVAGYDPEHPEEFDPDTLFSIKVYEHEVDEAGKFTPDRETAAEVTENEYKDILPGSVLDKDPTVENTGKYAAYIRVKVTVDKGNEWKAIIGNDLTTLFSGLDAEKWTKEGGGSITMEGSSLDAMTTKYTYTYYLNEALAPGAKATLFDKVNIPADITVEQFVTVPEFHVTVSAEAIQSENTGATPQEAFKLYDAQVNG